ncbi:zinc finger and BTB domain-containing protein 11-like [Gossypium australe]|uniref:Zinc finger and BTB domain-containing protein 11-like n=1 Tax=Gossypium australe TaxID=47621 RepID=A0A5B6VZ91_9ROSI|nr:zinc finger and BTB domain-containing protein 11-like [Gossypium australe]
MIDLRAVFVRLSPVDDGGLLANVSLFLRIKQVEDDKTKDFGFNDDGILCYHGDITILREAHARPYAMHPGGNKMYRDIKELYW